MKCALLSVGGPAVNASVRRRTPMRIGTPEKEEKLIGIYGLVVRTVCALLGLSFTFGPVLSPFYHRNQLEELQNATNFLLAQFGFMILACGAFGFILLYVAVTGRYPHPLNQENKK